MYNFLFKFTLSIVDILLKISCDPKFLKADAFRPILVHIFIIGSIF